MSTTSKFSNFAPARAPTQGSATISTSDPNMGVGYEVPLGCLRVAGEEFEIFDFSTRIKGSTRHGLLLIELVLYHKKRDAFLKSGISLSLELYLYVSPSPENQNS